MILILIYWSVLFLFASLSGIALQYIFSLSKTNTAFTLLYGIIFQTLFLSTFSFFYKISFEVFILNFSLQLLFYLKFKAEFLLFLKNIFKSYSNPQLYVFFAFIMLIVLKSALLPSIFDNESYYIQTIKWCNEYGFVKGVANVHPFLGQFSFWHVLQSGFTFSFLPIQFNDINGFVLVIGIYYFFEKYILKGYNLSFFGIVFLIFYYQFIDSPSPDLPILVLSAIVFNEFIENSDEVKAVLLLIVFMVFIKVTIVPLLLITVFYIYKNKIIIPYFTIISLLFGSIWIFKNIIITGYPLFPLAVFETNYDWKLPIESITYMYQNINNLGYAKNAPIHISFSLPEKLNFWIRLKGIDGFFNKGIIVLVCLVPFTKYFKTTKNFKILYLILLLHFIFLLLTSPQYRFFLPTFILFSTVLLYEFSTYFTFQLHKIVLILSLFLITTNLFFVFKNKTNTTFFQFNQLIVPQANTKYINIKFEKKNIGNFSFYDPNLPNFYETSNGELPCVNEKMLHFYNYYPQQRATEIKDGFYAKPIVNE